MKNLKISLLSLFFILLFTLNLSVNATSTTISNGYNTPIITESFSFQADLQSDGSVKTYWKAYNKDEKLKYYKLVRSSSNSNPVYPDDGYIAYSSDINYTQYTDSKIPSGVSYYRVCAITYENNRYCSNVIKIYKEEIKKEYNTKNEVILKTSVTTNNSSSSLKIKADKLVKDFISKVEKKYSTTEKRIEILKTVNSRFELLAKNNSRAKEIINYLIEKFQEQINYYDDGFSEIESILNEY